MNNSMTIYMDVLHDSILGEKDEPITVINLLHIKANVLRKLFCALVSFCLRRKWEKNSGNGASSLLLQLSGCELLPRGVSHPETTTGWLGNLLGSVSASPEPL